MQKMISEKRSARKPLFILLWMIGIILVVIGILTVLMMSDPNQDRTFPVAKSDTVVAKLGVAAVTGEPARLTAEEVNGLLAARSSAQPVDFSINSDDTVGVYLPVNYKGIHLGVSATLTVGYDSTKKQILAEVHSAQIGRLPVQPAWALNYLKKNLPQGVSVSGNDVRADASLFTTRILANSVGLELSGLEVTGGYFVLNVSGNTDELKNYILQKLPSYLALLN
jgi:hypothetical protein